MTDPLFKVNDLILPRIVNPAGKLSLLPIVSPSRASMVIELKLVLLEIHWIAQYSPLTGLPVELTKVAPPLPADCFSISFVMVSGLSNLMHSSQQL